MHVTQKFICSENINKNSNKNLLRHVNPVRCCPTVLILLSFLQFCELPILNIKSSSNFYISRKHQRASLSLENLSALSPFLDICHD